MPQDSNPTEGKFQAALLKLWKWLKRFLPSKQDPVTAAVAIPAAIALFVLHGKGVDVVPMAAAIALALVAPTATWLGGKYRVAAVTVSCFLLAAIVASTWRQVGYWLAIPAALAVWVPWSIGRTRRKPSKHAAALVKQGLAMVSEGLAIAAAAEFPESGVKVGTAKLGRNGTAVVADGHVSTSNGRGNGSVAKGAENTIASRLANRLAMPTPALVGVDLSATKAAGSFELAMRLVEPFAYDTLPMPPKKDWPAGEFPLGTDALGRPVYLAIKTLDHVLVSGRTRWGKSNTLWIILLGLARSTEGAVELQMIDPKGGAELGAWRHLCSDFAKNPDEGCKLLARLVATMHARYRQMQAAGQRKSTMWPIVCIIDEAAQVLDDKKARAHSLELAQMALAANIHIIYATQYPTDDLFGSALKQNISTVITHRLKDSTGSNVAMGQGAKGDGWDASKLEKPGRAIIELPHLVEARMKVQVYLAPDDVPDDLTALNGTPAPPPAPPTGKAPTQGEYEGVQGAGAGAGAPPEDDDPRPAKDRIEGLLSKQPRSASWLGEMAGCARQTADKHLKALAQEHQASYLTGRGWVRYDASITVDSDDQPG
jgi:uncharacterized membrane protein YphA (DoxX/SURF4 family)